MTVYRDCSTLDGANFDNPAAVTIYRGDNAPYNLVENISAGIVGGVEFVPPDDIPCLIPPSGICVEKATYIFTRTLPNIDESYHIVYQRCCRNETITNIYTPGDLYNVYTWYTLYVHQV